MSIEIEREKLERMLMLLAVATFHTPALQAERTELVEAGLKALAAPVQEPEKLECMNCAAFGECNPNNDAGRCGYEPPAAQPAPVQEPVTFKIYKPISPQGAVPNVRDAELPWVYDQDPSSGNVASMWVTPVKATPPTAQRQWVGLSDEEVVTIGKELGLKCKLGGNPNIDFDYAEAIEAKLKQKNTP